MKLSKIIILLFLLLWWFNSGFINRITSVFNFEINAFKIFSFLLFLLTISKKELPLKFVLSNRPIFFIILYVFAITNFSLFYSLINISSLPFSVIERYLVQLFSFIISISMAYLLSKFFLFNSKETTRFFFYGLILLILTVVWQLMTISYSYIPRLYGLAGEPKALGLYLVPMIISLIFVPVIGPLKRYLIIIICFSILIFSYSSTAFLAFVISFVFLSFFLSKRDSLNINFSFVVILAVAVISLFVIFPEINEIIFGRILNRSKGEFTIGVQTFIDFPFVGRVTVDGNDAPVARMLIDKPWLVFTGVGYGFQTVFAHEYLLKYDSGMLDSFYEGYITPNIALLNHLSNYGIILFLFIFFDGLKTVKKLLKYNLRNDFRFIVIYFSTWFIITSLVYEIAFKIVFLYMLLKIFDNYSEKINLSLQ